MKKLVIFRALIAACFFQGYSQATDCGVAHSLLPETGQMRRQAIDSSRARGAKKVLYIRVNFADDQSEPITAAEAASAMQQVDAFYQANSYGLLSLTTTVTPLLTLPQPRFYYRTNSQTIITLLADARAVAKNNNFNTDQFDLDAVAFVPIYTQFAGNAIVGGKGIWLQTKSASTAAHEIGHNLGLYHANTWNAWGDSIVGDGFNLEYGNNFDIMGLSSGQGQFSAYYKNLLGWIPNTNVLTVSSSGIYRLHPFDAGPLKNGNAYAFTIRKDAQKAYWLDTRSQVKTNASLTQGIHLNWSAWDKSLNGSQLLDATPSSPGGIDDAALVVGKTFADPSAGVFVTPIARVGDAYDVAVNLGAFATNRSPVLTFNAIELLLNGTLPITNILSVPTVQPGNPLSLLATASDPDKDTLAYFYDFGDGTTSANTNLISKIWTTEGDYRVRCIVSDLKGLTASASIFVRVGNPQTRRVSGRITQAGRNLADVRVSLNSSAQTFSDTDGRFTLAGLANGTYVLTPAKPGFTFTPPTLTLTIASVDVPAADFTARTTNLFNNTPLVEMIGPALDFVYAPGASANLIAKVTDDGLTNAVTFFEGGAVLGSPAIGTTNLLVSGLAAGDHQFTISAVDEFGATGASAPWRVRVATAASANNNIEDAIPIPASGIAGHNVLATSEPFEPRHAGFSPARSVWFTYTPATTTTAVLDLSGQITNSLLAVYTGDSFKNLVPVVSRVAFSSNQISFTANAGTTYQVAVDDALNSPGSFRLRVTNTVAPVINLAAAPQNPPITAPGANVSLTAVASDADGTIDRVEFYNGDKLLSTIRTPPYSFSLSNLGIGAYALRAVAVDNVGGRTESSVPVFRIPPPNDDFLQAIPFAGLSASLSGTNDGASHEEAEPSHAGLITSRSVWYRWTAPGKLGAAVSIQSALAGRVVAVYQANGTIPSLSLVASNYSASFSAPASVSFNADSGATYFFAVDDANSHGGDFSLNLITTALPTASLSVTPNSSPLPIGATVRLSGTGTDSDGTVATLAFYDGKVLLGSSAGSTGSFTLTNLGVGTHTFTARAIDNLGAFGVSTPVVIRVPALNDSFNNPQQIVGTNAVIFGTNDGSSKQTGEPDHANYRGGRSLWYSWTAPADLAALLTLSGDINFGILAAYRGTQVNALTNIATGINTNAIGIAELTFNARAGETFHIVLDDFSDGAGNNFRLDFRTTLVPAIVFSSVPSHESNVTPGTEVRFLAEASDADGSIVLVEFFDGKNLIASMTNPPYHLTITNFFAGSLEVTAKATDNLGAQIVSSNISIRIPPPNDFFTNALAIVSNPATFQFVSKGASIEPGEPLPAGLPGGKSLWWNWTAPTNGLATFSTDGSEFDTLLTVFTGARLTNLFYVSFDDDGGPNKTSRLTFDARAGQNYLINLDGYEGDAGKAVLNFSFGGKTAITKFERSVSGGFNFTLVGPSTGTNVFEVSTNLVDWTPLFTSTNGLLRIDFTDPATNGVPYQFYRNRRQ